MQKSQELVDEAGIVPFLQLFVKKDGGGTSPTGAHEVKVLSDKIVKAKDFQTGDDIPVVEYLLEEDGRQVRYQVPVKDKKGELHYLIQRLADVDEGETIVLEGKRGKNRSFVEVRRMSDGEVPTVQAEDDPFFETSEDEKQ